MKIGKDMSKIKIVTDSSLTIEPELVEKYNITVVPLTVMIDGVLYSDNDGNFSSWVPSGKFSEYIETKWMRIK